MTLVKFEFKFMASYPLSLVFLISYSKHIKRVFAVLLFVTIVFLFLPTWTKRLFLVFPYCYYFLIDYAWGLNYFDRTTKLFSNFSPFIKINLCYALVCHRFALSSGVISRLNCTMLARRYDNMDCFR